MYYLVRPVLFPEFTSQLTVAPRSRSLPDLKSRGAPDHPIEGFEIRELQSTDCSAASGRCAPLAGVGALSAMQREAAMPRPKGGGNLEDEVGVVGSARGCDVVASRVAPPSYYFRWDA